MDRYGSALFAIGPLYFARKRYEIHRGGEVAVSGRRET